MLKNKRAVSRSFVILFALLPVGFVFQNCGQAGTIAVVNDENANLSLGGSTPDPVTLISNVSLSINNKQPYTKSKNVMVQSTAVGAEEMLLSHNADCAGSDVKWEEFSQEKAWVLSSENESVSVYAKFRKKGAPETSCVRASIVHDSLAPEVRVVKPAPRYTSLSNVQIGFEVVDGQGSGVAKAFCKPSNGAEIECAEFVNFSSLVNEGTYSVVIRALDKLGNESAPLTSAFVVDRTPPVITINGPSGVVADRNLKYKFSIVESNGVQYAYCRLLPLESEFKICAGQAAEYTDLNAGVYKFEVQAADLANNASTASQTVEIDLSVPTVKLTKTPLALGNSKNVGFEFTGVSGERAITKFTCALDGVNPGACSSPLSIANLPDKEYVFSVYGTNAAGVNSAAQSYKFIVDTMPPTVSIVSGPSGVIKTNSATVVLSASDLNGLRGVQCYLNEKFLDCSAKSITYADLPDGNYSFYAVAYDLAGNAARTAALTWTVDTSPDSKILASMEQNPVKEGSKGILNISLTQVTQANYNCLKVSDNSVVASGAVSSNPAAIGFIVNEDISCVVSGKDKANAAIKVTVRADVNCGNKIKENGKCVDFKCLSFVNLPYTNSFSIPARTSAGICYVMKIFNGIANSSSSLTKTIDTQVVSRNHDSGGGYHNPYSMGSALLNFVLSGPRVVKLSGGTDASAPIKVDNFALVGLYPKAVAPVPAHYAAYGTRDATVTPDVNYVIWNDAHITLTPFASGGTASVAPLEIVREADTNLNYMLDVRALDCGGSRELSDVYVLFQ